MKSWFEVEKIDGNTYAISEYGHVEKVHSFLFVGKNRAALIDTGLGVADIKGEVKKITPLPIIVITTHAHWDHIGGHKSFDEIRVHSMDASWLEKGIPLPCGVLEEAFSADSFLGHIPEWFKPGNYEIYKGKPSYLLEDGEIIKLGERELEIIHTPGHSPGHICIYEAESGFLVTGDLLYEGTLYCHFESTNPKDYLASLDKIAFLKVKKILPGHNDLHLPLSSIKSARDLLRGLKAESRLVHGSGMCGEGRIRIIL